MSGKCVQQNLGFEDQPCPVTLPTVPDSQSHPCWGSVPSPLVLSQCLGWHLCEASLLSFVTRWGMGKQLVQKHPGSLLPVLWDLICLSFCVLMNSKQTLGTGEWWSMFVEIKRKISVIRNMRSSIDFKMWLEVFKEVDFCKAKQGSISGEWLFRQCGKQLV